MSITITVESTKINIDNNTDSTRLNMLINELEKITKIGIELDVFIIDMKTAEYHKYAFDYLPSSKLSPRQFLLNNILYSITCDETNMTETFNEIIKLLWTEKKLIK